MTSALAEPPWCVCSACLGTPAVFPLSVMQLAALLGFPWWLTQVGCSTPAVMVSHGVGGCLVTAVLFPPCFLFCACAASPSAASPSGFCPLTEWVGMSVSSLLVYSSVWLEGSCCDFFLCACALFSLLQVHWDFLGFSCFACLLGWLGLCTLCLGVPVAVLSAWFAGGVPLLPFPYLRVGVLLAKVSPEFVGYEGSFGCPSWFFILFRYLLVHFLFLELGWFLVTRWWLLLRLLVLVSSDARSHIPDAFASSSTPISGSWMVLASVLSCALPWVRPSRFPCWLLARDDWDFSLVVLPP